MKTYDDFYNDPAIMDEPRALREIHAVRLKIQDERKNMTIREFSMAAEESAIAIAKKYNTTLVWADLKPAVSHPPAHGKTI
jgi:hypothetical protein